MLNEIDVLKDAAGRLDHAGLAYMLTGSLAMNYYAQPRMTRDIDLVVALQAKDVETVTKAFSPAYYIAEEAVTSAVARESVFNALHLESVIKVDLIVRKSSPYHIQEFARRRQIAIRDFRVWIASKEDLIVSKLHWARDSRSELQLRDVRNLLATECDRAYLEGWIRQLGLERVWEECQRG